MARSRATTADAYLEALPLERRAVLSAVRGLILRLMSVYSDVEKENGLRQAFQLAGKKLDMGRAACDSGSWRTSNSMRSRR